MPRLMILLVLVLGVIAAACSSRAGTIETVEPAAAAEVIAENPDAIVLDIRTPEEYADGIIEGAVNIDFYAPDFAAKIEALDRDAEYVVYCRSDNRSGEAMGLFADLEFEQVSEIDGGIVNWYSEGLPVVLP